MSGIVRQSTHKAVFMPTLGSLLPSPLAALLLAAAATLGVPALPAQAPRPAQPQFKGIFEPVSYGEDLGLADVFFVTADVGWAAGDGGTIVHTRDGGATWTAQLGGEAGSADPPIRMLRFVDEHRGWAVQQRKLLHTANGQDWEEVDGTLPNGMSEYTFVSGRKGFASGTSTTQGWPTELFVTEDGGRTWKPVAVCEIRVAVEGLNRKLSCIIDRIQFVTRELGYLIAHVQCVGVGCGGPPVLGKTEDGGASWRFMVGPGDVKLTQLKDLFFVDERVGFVHAYTFPSDPKIFSTTDGGETWKGVVGSPGRWLRFADPEIGWGVDEYKLNYTTNGGARWSSRPHRFPANPRAVSFPRRDRGYVVGDHGMVFRYRVVPASQATPAEVIVTAPMPGVASSLDEEAAAVATALAELEAAVDQAPDSTPAEAPATDSVVPFVPEPEALVAEAPTPFTAGCCGPPLDKLNLVVLAIAKSLPSFLAQYKNTNLLVAGLRIVVELPGKFGDLRAALWSFKHAADKDAANAALAQIGQAAQALHQTTKAALQQEIPPLGVESGTPGALEPDAGPTLDAAAEPAAAVADSGATALPKEAVAKAKKGLGGLLKKKIKVPGRQS